MVYMFSVIEELVSLINLRFSIQTDTFHFGDFNLFT